MMNDEFPMTNAGRNPKRECPIRSRAASNSGFGLRNALVIRHSSFAIRQQAFTLLELLLAVLVFAIVLAAVHTVFFSAFRLRNKTVDAVERSLPLQQALAVIKRDLANLVPPGGTLAGALQSTPTLTTTATGVSLSGTLNRQSGPQFFTAVGIVDETNPWGDIARVGYYLAPATNNTPGMDLFRAVARNLLPATQDETDDQFLMNGVDTVNFQYFDGTSWQDTWDSTLADTATGLSNNLPAAIKVQLQLHNENPRAGTPAPLELVVPIMVLARTNASVALTEESP